MVSLKMASVVRGIPYHRLALVLLGLNFTALFGVADPPTIPEDVKQSARQRVDNGYCPGIVIGVISPQGRQYFSYGRTMLTSGQLPDKDTVFEIGSVTKVFTGLLLADMIERRELTPDDVIDKYLPDSVRAPTRNQKRITLIDLATHTSGLPRIPDNMPNCTIDNPYSGYSPELMYAFLSNYQLLRDIGSKFEYSNYGMGLLGYLLAQKSGATYESLVRRRICEKLGMPDTSITLTAAMEKRLAHGHRGDSRVPNWDMAALAGAGALRSTANDMLTFLAANMGLQENPLRAAMDLAQTPCRPADKDGMQVGLAWLILTGVERPICWHNGGTGGYRSFIGFDKAAKMGIVVLANSSQDVDDIGFHFLLPSIPLSDYSAAAAKMPRPVAVALLPGEKLPTGEALFERAIQQLGGRTAMNNVQNLRMEAKMEMMGINGSIIAYQVRTGQLYSKMDLHGLISAEGGTDGTVTWEVDSLQGPRIITGREKEISRIVAPFDLAIGKELYRTFKCDGKYQVQGQVCYKVVATSKDHAIPITWYFAADSGLPVGKQYTLEKGNAKMPIEERLGDYRRVEKLLYPFDVRQLVQGIILHSRIKRIEHNVSIPPGRFDPPEAVKKIR